MKVIAENMENSRIALNIEAETHELDKSLNEAYQRLVSRVSVPGFRKGKTPRAILEQYIGKDALLDEALKQLIPQLYKQAIESQKLEPVDQPEIEVSQTEPLMFRAILPLKPTIKLGDYHNIKLEPELVEISDGEIEAAIEQLRQGQGVWVPVERPVEFGDLITINVEADVEGKPFLNHKDMVYEVTKNATFSLPGFGENLEGANKNEQRIFTLSIPADYSVKEFAEKQCLFKVSVNEVKERELPEMNEEFARSIGYDNLAAMREKVAADLKLRAEEKARLELREEALKAVIEQSEVDYPPILEDRELDRFLQDEARRFGFKEAEEYLKRANKTREEYKEKLHPMIKQRIISTLVLEKMVEEEKVEISASEADNKIREIIENSEDSERTEQFLALPQVRESIEQSLRLQKTVDRLVQIVTTDNVEDKTKEERCK